MINPVLEASRNLIERVAQLESALLKIDKNDAALRPAPGKWSKKEIIGHLIDSACNNHQKFVRTQLSVSGHLDFPRYAQNDWVAVQQYQNMDWAQIIALWKAYNLHLASVMEACPEATYTHTISVDGSEPLRLDFIMTDYVAHLDHHMKAVFPPIRQE